MLFGRHFWWCPKRTRSFVVCCCRDYYKINNLCLSQLTNCLYLQICGTVSAESKQQRAGRSHPSASKLTGLMYGLSPSTVMEPSPRASPCLAQQSSWTTPEPERYTLSQLAKQKTTCGGQRVFHTAGNIYQQTERLWPILTVNTVYYLYLIMHIRVWYEYLNLPA